MLSQWLKTKGKRGSSTADATNTARIRRQARIRKRLEEDPHFQVCTFDGLSWIDPTTGNVIAAPFSWQDEAERHLRQIEQWHKKPIMTMDALRRRQWEVHLQEEMREDRRLRLFDDDGRWLNPVTGVWSSFQRQENSITTACLKVMATELSALEATPAQIKPLNTLLEAQLPRRQETDSKTTAVHVRPSGRLIANQSVAPPPAESWLTDVDQPTHGAAAVLSRPLEDVGGDLSLIEELDDGRSLIMLADASGHGEEAAAISNAAAELISESIADFTDLPSLLGMINDGLEDRIRPGQFLTCFAAIYDPRDASLLSCCAGHHHALIANATDETVLRRFGRHGMALGIRAGKLFVQSMQVDRTTLRPGDTLFCYTDGLCEATNEAGSELGHWGAVAAFVGHLERSPSRIIAKILTQLRAYNKGQFDDDLTMMVFRYLGPNDDH